MAAPPKPFRTEYAKSNRSTCQKCKSLITKDTLRIARVVPATQFDGYMPVWHHASCILKKPGQIENLDDVEGVDSLRWEDQQMLRIYIEGRASDTSTSKTEHSGSATAGVDGEYAIESAKSSRATCKSCNEKIEKGQARISTMASADTGKYRGKVPVWRHAKCFLDIGCWLQPTTEIPGWEDLSTEDQDTVKKLLKSGPSKLKGSKGTKHEPSNKTGEPQSVPKQDNKKRKKKGQDEPVLEKNAGSREESGSRKKRAREGHDQPTALGAQETVGQEESDVFEKKLEKQSKALWEIKDNLKKNVDTSMLRMMLEENGQDSSGSEYDLRECCADGMLFGPLDDCPTCGGHLEFHGGKYRCKGNLSEWSKCTYTTLSPKRLKSKWKIPEDLENAFLAKWFKTQKIKKEERLLLAKSLAKPAVNKQVEASEKKDVKGTVGDDNLKGMRIVIVGDTEEKWKPLIEPVGGQIFKKITRETDYVVTSETELEREENKTKLQYAQQLRIPIVKEEFLADCLKKGARLPVDQYILETTSKLSSIVKVKVKGRSAVHEESGLQDSGHILEESKTIFNTTLNLSDLSTGINSYYILQIIEHDTQNVHHLFRRWGRVGNSKIGASKLEKLSKGAAVAEFKRLFREKTGNNWEAWESKVGFQKQPNKFFPLEIDYGVEKSSQDMKFFGSKSKLHPRVTSLMKMLFDIETYKAAMMEFEINTNEMPLGKLSKRNIDEGFKVLTEIQNIIGSDSSEKMDSLLTDASNRFFTLIPHVHPQVIENEQALKIKIEMLEALRDIEIASKIIGSTGDDTDEDPLDVSYKKLHCNIVSISHDSADFQLVKTYLERTHAPTHKDWSLEVEDVYAVDREGEYEAFAMQKEKLANRMLLWHGSRTTNFVGILSQGLRIAPPEAPVTGYMFGKGIYFADLVSKSAQYCYTSKNSPVGLMLLSEVALGEMYELTGAKYIEKLPPGKSSTKGLGRTMPLESEFETWGDQVTVPCGRPVPSGVQNTQLMYNEYIVYDINQVNLRFLLKVRFKHKY